MDKKGYSQGVFRFLSAKGKEWLLGEFGPVKPSPESGGLQLTREGFMEEGLLQFVQGNEFSSIDISKLSGLFQ